jgi:outer membrane protein assembly factor BamB
VVRCDKSHPMKTGCALLAMVPLLCLCACSGGGGGSTPLPPVPAWEKFRHDANNSGEGSGPLANNNGSIKWMQSIDGTPILGSPAIDVNGTLYVGTEGGTFAALDPTTGSILWSVCSCDDPGGTTPVTCQSGTPSTLGALTSSPAVFAFGSATNFFIGSAAPGAVYVFQNNGTTRTCVARFQPDIASRFISSPTFTINPSTGALSGIFIGAAVDVIGSDTTHTIGRLYALNSNGTLIWQYPDTNGADIGPITSSPALGPANELLFTAADSELDGGADNLYSVTNSGLFRWRFPIGTVADARAPFAASPLTSNLVFVPSASGQVFAINPDGSFRWSVSSPDGSGFVASLANGPPATTTPSLTPTEPPTPTPPPGATATPVPATPTVTPLFLVNTIFAVTLSGDVLLIDTNTGDTQILSDSVQPIIGPVVASPFLSTDSYLVVGAADGLLHAINTATGEPPPDSTWPVQLGEGLPIRSSPSVDVNGVVYVGDDDGFLYAVGTQ